MEIEKLATAAVTSSLSKTDRLSSFLSEGDKEPSWDGNIYIHEDNTHSKKNLKKVPAQIKGKLALGVAEDTIRYPVDILDLRAYQSNGGALYFVVYLDENTGDTIQIYYSSLLPFKISELLKGKDNKDSLTITLKKFPDDKNGKTEILLNFYDDAQLQTSFAGKELPTIEELEQQGVLESVSIHYTGLQRGLVETDFPRIIEGKELFLYANVTGSPAPIPVEYIDNISGFTVGKDVHNPVCVGDEKYFDTYKVLTTADKVTFHIGNCLTLSFPNVKEPFSEHKVSVNITTKGSLNQRLKAYPFIDALIKAESFKIGNAVIPLKIEEAQLSSIHYESFDETIQSLQRVKRVFDKLHIKKDLDLDACDNMDYWRLNSLVGAIDEDATVYGVKGDLPAIVNVNIANLHLVMLCQKTEDNGYNLWDFFDKTIDVVIVDGDDSPHPTSQYAILRKHDFYDVDNLYLQGIIEGFKSVKAIDCWNADQANNVLLEMLKAYDEHKNGELLEGAEQLSDWLLTQTEYITPEIATINRLQIKARSRKLSFDEKQTLADIAKSSDEPLHRAGAFILLNESAEVDAILSAEDQEKVAAFKDYPIYHLYKPQEEKKNG